MENGDGRTKPEFKEVYEYAQKQVEIYLHKHGSDLPYEQKDEVRQNALMRAWVAYQGLDPERGWKSFIQQHCHGAVLDYIRDGRGFEESGWETKKDDDELDPDTGLKVGEKWPDRIKHRFEVYDADTETVLDVEEVAGLNGVFFDCIDADRSQMNPRWPLVARLASLNERTHLVAMTLLGYSQTELAATFGCSRERLSQMIKEFCLWIDNPENLYSREVNQTIFAFGMSKIFHQPDEDNGYGWNLLPVNLFEKGGPVGAVANYQVDFLSHKEDLMLDDDEADEISQNVGALR